MDCVWETLIQYGVMGIILGWFMWRDVTVLQEFKNAMNDFRVTLVKFDKEIQRQDNEGE